MNTPQTFKKTEDFRWKCEPVLVTNIAPVPASIPASLPIPAPLPISAPAPAPVLDTGFQEWFSKEDLDKIESALQKLMEVDMFIHN